MGLPTHRAVSCGHKGAIIVLEGSAHFYIPATLTLESAQFTRTNYLARVEEVPSILALFPIVDRQELEKFTNRA